MAIVESLEMRKRICCGSIRVRHFNKSGTGVAEDT